MILGKDINPKKQIYYISAMILKELKHVNSTEFDFFEVYHLVKHKETDLSLNLYSLSLDWLFLMGAIKKEKNRLIKCF